MIQPLESAVGNIISIFSYLPLLLVQVIQYCYYYMHIHLYVSPINKINMITPLALHERQRAKAGEKKVGKGAWASFHRLQ